MRLLTVTLHSKFILIALKSFLIVSQPDDHAFHILELAPPNSKDTTVSQPL